MPAIPVFFAICLMSARVGSPMSRPVPLHYSAVPAA